MMKTAIKPQSRNLTIKKGKTGSIFGTSYENVVFVLCLIAFLIALSKVVQGESINSTHSRLFSKNDATQWTGSTLTDPTMKISAQRASDTNDEDGENSETKDDQEPPEDGRPDGLNVTQTHDDQPDGSSGTLLPDGQPSEPVTEATLPTVEAEGKKKVNIEIIYEDPDVLKYVDAAVDYVKKRSNVGVNVVDRFPATKTHDAVGLVTRLCKHMDALNKNSYSKPDLILDFTHLGIQSEAVKIITRTLKIPTISTSFGLKDDVREWMNLNEQQSRYLVRIPPPSGIISFAVRSIVDMQELLSASIFIGSDIEITYEARVTLMDLPARHHFVPMKSLAEISEKIQHEISIGFKNFFFITSPANITYIMEAIHKINMPAAYSWHLITMEHADVVDCSGCRNEVSVVFMSPPEPQENRPRYEKNSVLDKMFYFDITVDAITSVVKQVEEGNWPSSQIGRIPCATYDLKGKYTEIQVDLVDALSKNTKDFIGSYSLTGNGNNHANFELEVWNVTKSSSGGFEKTKIATWTAGMGGKELLQYQTQDIAMYRPRTVYNVGTVIHPPWVMWKPNCSVAELKNNGDEFAHCLEGYHIDVLNALAKEVGFNYFIKTYDTFGYLSSSLEDDWEGVMNAILRHFEIGIQEVDIAIGTMQYLPERLKVAEMTRTYGPIIGITVIMPKTRLYDISTFKFLTILEPQVWWCIIGAYFFTSFLLFVFDKYGPGSAQNTPELEEEEEEEPLRIFTVRECLWFCITSMTAQGGGEAPRGLSGRLVAATWWLFSFIIMASYTANMAAYLTVPGLTKPIMDFDELINQQSVQFAPIDKSVAWHYFDRMANVEQVFYERWRDMSLDDNLSDWNRSHFAVWTYPISDKFTKLWQSMVDNKPPENIEEAIERLNTGLKRGKRKFAFIAEEYDLKYVLMTNCGFRKVGEPFGHHQYTIGVRKGSPLKEVFNQAIDKLEQFRVIDEIYDRWWRHNPTDQKCDIADTTQAIPVINLTGLWYAAGIGMALSLVVTFIEWATITTKMRFGNKGSKGLGEVIEK